MYVSENSPEYEWLMVLSVVKVQAIEVLVFIRHRAFIVMNMVIHTGPQIWVRNENFFLFLNQNICCGYLKELSH